MHTKADQCITGDPFIAVTDAEDDNLAYVPGKYAFNRLSLILNINDAEDFVTVFGELSLSYILFFLSFACRRG